MDKLRRSFPFRALFIGLFSLLVLALSTSGAFAGSGCKKVSGKFTLKPVPAAECSSPAGICAAGTYKGDLAGSSAGIVTSVIATGDTPTTSVVLFTADTQLTTSAGTLLVKNAITYQTTPVYLFAELDTIIGGTGEWAGATGTLQATGSFDSVAGGDGIYNGVVCTP